MEDKHDQKEEVVAVEEKLDELKIEEVPLTANQKKKLRKKNKKAGEDQEESKVEAKEEVEEKPAAEDEAEVAEGEGAEGNPDQKKKKKRNKPKKKAAGTTYAPREQDNSHLRIVNNWEAGEYLQTSPPTIPISLQFAGKNNIYPVGEI